VGGGFEIDRVRRLRARLGRAVGIGAPAVVLLGLLSGGVAQAKARTRAPEAYGPHAVKVSKARIPVPVDPRGPEGAYSSLAADVYVPAGAGRWPVVQLSHAWPGTLRQFPLSGWGRRLASRGFVVIVSDRRAASASANPMLDQLADLQDFNSDVNGEDILRVLRWAVAQNATRGSVLFRKVDPRRLAIGGHSLGAYFATFAAVKSKTEGPRLSALVLLDPTDERLGDYTANSSLAVSPAVTIPTIVLASEANQHPVMCDMSQGPDCTIVSRQQYRALTGARPRFGLKVVGAVHEDVEDPNTGSTPSQLPQLRLFQRYGMAWLEFWLARDCSVAGYLGGRDSARDQKRKAIALYPGGARTPKCRATGRRPSGQDRD
jgi:dienelactone hydrolase